MTIGTFSTIEYFFYESNTNAHNSKSRCVCHLSVFSIINENKNPFIVQKHPSFTQRSMFSPLEFDFEQLNTIFLYGMT